MATSRPSSPYMWDSDETLLDRILAARERRTPHAENELAELVWRILDQRGLRGNRDRVGDRANELWVRGYFALLRGFDPSCHRSPVAYLVGSLQNAARDLHRAERTQRRVGNVTSLPLEEDPPAPGPLLEAQLGTRDELRRLAEQLEERERQVVELLATGMNRAEVAAAVNCHPSTITRLLRALAERHGRERASRGARRRKQDARFSSVKSAGCRLEEPDSKWAMAI